MRLGNYELEVIGPRYLERNIYDNRNLLHSVCACVYVRVKTVINGAIVRTESHTLGRI